MPVHLLRYTGVYLLVSVGLWVLGFAMTAVLGNTLPAGVMITLPPLIATMVEGQLIARTSKAQITSAAAWKVAFATTGVVAAINAVILGAIFVTGTLDDVFADAAGAPFLGVVAVTLVIILLINRYVLRFAIKSELKRMAAL